VESGQWFLGRIKKVIALESSSGRSLSPFAWESASKLLIVNIDSLE